MRRVYLIISIVCTLLAGVMMGIGLLTDRSLYVILSVCAIVCGVIYFKTYELSAPTNQCNYCHKDTEVFNHGGYCDDCYHLIYS